MRVCAALRSYQLTQAFAVDGVKVDLETAEPLTNMSMRRRVNNWPTAIFDWPGAFKNGNRCPNTSIKEQWWMNGAYGRRGRGGGATGDAEGDAALWAEARWRAGVPPTTGAVCARKWWVFAQAWR